MMQALEEVMDGTAWLRHRLRKADLDTRSLSGPDIWRAAAKAAAENVFPATTLPRPIRVRLLTLWCTMLPESERRHATTDPFPRAILAVRFGLPAAASPPRA